MQREFPPNFEPLDGHHPAATYFFLFLHVFRGQSLAPDCSLTAPRTTVAKLQWPRTSGQARPGSFRPDTSEKKLWLHLLRQMAFAEILLRFSPPESQNIPPAAPRTHSRTRARTHERSVNNEEGGAKKNRRRCRRCRRRRRRRRARRTHRWQLSRGGGKPSVKYLASFTSVRINGCIRSWRQKDNKAVQNWWPPKLHCFLPHIGHFPPKCARHRVQKRLSPPQKKERRVWTTRVQVEHVPCMKSEHSRSA